MNLSLACLACLLAIAAGAPQGAPQGKMPAPSANPRVLLETSKGNIVVELFADKAPKTADNFLQYVKSGFYNGTIFHRVIPGFMVQGGGMTPDMAEKPTRDPIQNEADNRVLNERGTLAMARTSDPHSASSQFFINLVNNGFLNHTGKNAQGWGYAVFGKVVEGMDVVDSIAGVRTGRKGMHENVPVEPVILKKATVVAKK
jgi:cyclophilin family peptidyl-prolyl cis-trans isomerase